MFMGFNVKVECESLLKNCEDSEVHDLLTTNSRVDNLQKVTWEAHARNQIVSFQAVFCMPLHDLVNPRVTRETLYLDDFK